MAVVAFRGGLQKRPLTPIHALDYLPREAAVFANNAPFNFAHTLYIERAPLRTYFTDSELVEIFELCGPLESDSVQYSIVPVVSQPNIMLIVLESYSQSYMGCYGAETSATPFLDSLSSHSVVFDHMTANGTRSVDGIPAIIAGLPSLSDRSFITSTYQTNKIEGLGTHLGEIGYNNAFFHGGNNGTFNFDKFSRLAGFEDYYGRDEYNNNLDFDGNWGIWDEPFFQYACKEISSGAQPFCHVLYSLSSHHPFKLPEKFNNEWNDLPNELFRSIRYTDFSLSQFFKKAEKEAWFENTVFFITSDHCGPRNSMKESRTHDKYDIPLLVYSPQNAKGERISHRVQQVDILPTVLSLAGFEGSLCQFGKSLFDDSEPGYVCHRLDGFYQIRSDDYILDFDGGDNSTLYRRSGLDRKPLTNAVIHNELLRHLKAIIQTYDRALRNNELAKE
jgi:phosphoglycerol transferase MdoB-like AlkP superfamily enzyme